QAPLVRKPPSISQNVTAEILVLHDLRQLLAHVVGIYFDRLFLQVGTFEGDLLQQLLENRVQPPRADILGRFVHARGKGGDLLNGVVGERELDALSVEQRLILLDQRVLGLLQDANKVGFVERLQLDADRKTALQLGDQVAGLGNVKGARGD